MNTSFFHSLLWKLLIPVILTGLATSLLLIHFLVPPLVSSIEERMDTTIRHTASMAINICEERLSDMLDLRMEENEEMNKASKTEAIKEISELSRIFPIIQMVVVDENGTLHGSHPVVTADNNRQILQDVEARVQVRQIFKTRLLGQTVLFDHRYFPFWRWHIISFIAESEFSSPIIAAKRIIQFGTFGTLLAVVISTLLLFWLYINRPLRRIIETTEEIRIGNFKQLNEKGDGEIEEVAVAFDHMVEKLHTDKIKIEHILQELSDSEEKYRVLSENSLALVAVVANDCFRYTNRAVADFFNGSRENLIGTNIFSLFDRDNSERLRSHMRTLSSGSSGVEHFELRYQPPGEDERWLEVLASVTPYDGTASILVHALDISTKKQLEAEQESMQEKIARGERMEMLGTLAGGVAHDLNNILGGIVGYPDLLMQGMGKEDRLYKPLQTIRKSGIKAAAIVQDLLTLTRRGVVVTEIVNMRNIIYDYIASPEFENLWSFYPDMNINLSLDEDLMNVAGSSHHLSKAIMNLITNSAEAMPGGGTITIQAENRYVDTPIGNFEEVVEGEYAAITISDTGEGIDQKNLKKIFEPFYTKKVMGRSGTGLGMSVVWGTVKDHQGYIEVFSEKSKGTTITLYFPATRKSIKEEIRDARAKLFRGSGERVLVVDDVEEQRLIGSSMLENLGYTVDLVASGEAAVEAVTQREYPFILLDMIMDPGMDGLETYQEILKIHPSQRVIVASGYSETDRIRHTLSLGVGLYLKKPYSLTTLANAVKTVVSGV